MRSTVRGWRSAAEGSLDDLSRRRTEYDFGRTSRCSGEAEGGREATGDEKVDCITVNLAPFKAAVDDPATAHRRAAVGAGERHRRRRSTISLLRRWRRLSRGRSRSTRSGRKKEWREIVQNKERQGALKLEELPQMAAPVEARVELARSRSGGARAHVNAFNERVEEQMRICAARWTELKELQQLLSKFAARWNERKPKKLEAADPGDGAVIARVKEWEEEFHEGRDVAQELLLDYEDFGIHAAAAERARRGAADIERSSRRAGCTKSTPQFAARREDWISFRGRSGLRGLCDRVAREGAPARRARRRHLKSELAKFPTGAAAQTCAATLPADTFGALPQAELEKVARKLGGPSSRRGSAHRRAEEVKTLNARATGGLLSARQSRGELGAETSFSLTGTPSGPRGR